MPPTVSIGLMVLGGVLLLIPIIGGKFKIFGAEVSDTISSWQLRLLAGVLGIIFVLVAIFQSSRSSLESKGKEVTIVRGVNARVADQYRPILQRFSGKVVQITACPDQEPTSFATSLVLLLRSAGVVASINTTPNACDAHPVRIVARDDGLLKLLADVVKQATGQSPLLQPGKAPNGNEDAVVVIGNIR